MNIKPRKKIRYEKPALVGFSTINAHGQHCQPVGSAPSGTTKCQVGGAAAMKCQAGGMAGGKCKDGATPG